MVKYIVVILMDNTFLMIIRPIVKTKEFKTMKKHNHHSGFSTYYHSIKVAYLAYKYAKKHNVKLEINSLVRGALLHDFYLYDWHDKGGSHRLHGFRHPRFAYNNALKLFPDISLMEKDIILHHMFPLTIIPPHTKGGWIVCYCDKVATCADYKKKKNPKPNA